MTTAALHTEQELLSKLAEGDSYAFEQIYLLYSPKLYAKLLQLVKQTAIAEELLQDVFVKIWEKRSELDNQKSFRAFIYTIAKNMVVDLFRRAALDRKILENFILENSEIYDPFEKMNEADNEVKEALQKALTTLPPQRKKIYTLVKLDGMSYDEVAQLLNISTSTVNDHIVKATKALRAYFDNNDATLFVLVASILIFS